MMDRADFARIGEESLNSYIATPARDASTRLVRMTSGTSGRPPIVFIREQPGIERGWFTHVRHPVLCGGGVPWRLGWTLFFRDEKTESPSQLLLIDARDLDQDLADLLEDFGADFFCGFPSVIARAASYVRKPIAVVRAIVMTGEPLRSAILGIFREKFPNATFQMQYMIQEIGHVSDPRYCPHLSLHQYHPVRGVELELLDPDEEGVGELLVSATINRNVAIERYRYGDLARIKHEPCACGAKTTFEILGRRGHDFVRIGGATLRREEFDRVFLMHADSLDDYRVEVRGAVPPTIILRLRTRKELSQKELERLAESYRDNLFVTASQTLGTLIEKGAFTPLEIAIAQTPFLEKNKDVKIAYVE